jgi:hypothetical protein
MKKLILLLMLISLPCATFALEQSFTQQGLKATIKLSPEKLETDSRVQLSLSLSKEGINLTDKDVTLEVYERNNEQPVIKRRVDVLDTEYVDSWKFEKAGDYKVVINIADHQKPDEVMHYEVNATVMAAGGEHSEHGFFAHHFGGGKWGWWGPGLMLIMMIPMMILVL